ncbi:hypothetical protein ACOMHN_067792 [Nucella lapillus]
MRLLKQKKSAVDAVTAAVAVLEDSELTNAGRGSSLTLTGSAECDASVMEGGGSLFGAVGCVSGVLNPVQVACRLLQAQQYCSLSLGRVPPSVLVGTGATEWAREQGFSCEDHNKLITDNSNRLYRKYKRKVERAERSSTVKKARHSDDDRAATVSKPHNATSSGRSGDLSSSINTTSSGRSGDLPSSINTNSSLSELPDFTYKSVNRTIVSQTIQSSAVMPNSVEHGTTDSDEHRRECNGVDERRDAKDDPGDEDEDEELRENPVQDTVGAVCVDWQGNISTAVSSGGIWLKQPGRLGPHDAEEGGCDDAALWYTHVQDVGSGYRGSFDCDLSGVQEGLDKVVHPSRDAKGSHFVQEFGVPD